MVCIYQRLKKEGLKALKTAERGGYGPRRSLREVVKGKGS